MRKSLNCGQENHCVYGIKISSDCLDEKPFLYTKKEPCSPVCVDSGAPVCFQRRGCQRARENTKQVLAGQNELFLENYLFTSPRSLSLICTVDAIF